MSAMLPPREVGDLFAGDGEMSRLMRAHDWSATPLGPVEGWPQALKIVIRILLGSRYAMWLGWGPEFTFFYNDAYARMTLGPKHPWALGRSAREVWAEIWDDIGPRAESVIRTGRATWDERLLLFLERLGFREETYHTFSYSPVPDDRGGVGGMLCVVTEETERAIGERRLRTLRELAARTTAEARSAEDACQTAVRTLAANPQDLPFVLLYLISRGARTARLAGATGLAPGSAAAPPEVGLTGDSGDIPWPLARVGVTGQAAIVTDVRLGLGPSAVGVYPEPPHTVAVLPVRKSGQDALAGFLVAGISPRRPLDDDYRGFLDLVAGQIATAVANARAYEEERRRAEALAELDRAKTTFFSNVSHEFRTPLTLMLGPVEEILVKPYDQVMPANRELLEVVHRNGLRLQKLVNTLLDFSRIEAGRVQASYEPTDLAAFTAELASSFRSACERAGLELRVDCPPLDEPVYVDRDMWEKVVLNLVSNAFKYTWVGRIDVRLRACGPSVQLVVQDTGTGIPPDQMSHLFERFHRVEGAMGRTQEGSGIGLALVRELVRLHGGEVSAESCLGQGSTFTVTIPLGAAHLPPERVRAPRTLASTALGAAAYVEEAMRWLPEPVGERTEPSPAESGAADEPPVGAATGQRPLVLLADDNADMRDYIRRLLTGRYDVIAVADGLAARDAARARRPDLVLSDVMMPGLDGFGLLRELRADPRTAEVPFLLLSARAGEEARVEGLQAGADDYLTKPFSARELLARIGSALEIARLRREALDRERRLLAEVEAQRHWLRVTLSSIGDAVIATDNEGRVIFLNPVAQALTGWGEHEAEGKPLSEIYQISNEATGAPAENPVARVLREERRVTLTNHTLLTARDGTQRPIDDSAAPIRGADGATLGVVLIFRDVTERRHTEEEIRRLNRDLQRRVTEFQALLDVIPIAIAVAEGPDCHRIWSNPAMARLLGLPSGANVSLSAPSEERPGYRVFADGRELPPEELPMQRAIATGREVRGVKLDISLADGTGISLLNYAVPLFDEAGRIRGGLYVGVDVTEQERTQAALRASEERFRQLADAMPQIVWTARPDGIIDYSNRRWYELSGCPEGVGNDGWATIVHPEDLPPASAQWAECVRTGEPFDRELRLHDRRTGGYRWHLIRSVAARDERGAVVHWYGTATDIHRQKRTEEAARFLAEASAALARLVDYESTLQKVANLAVPYFADWSAVDLVGEGGALRRLAIAHRDPQKVRLAQELERRYPPDPEAPAGIHHVLRTGRPEIVELITDEMLVQGAKDAEHLHLLRGLGLRSFICVPLVVSGKALGVLTFATAESGRGYDHCDLALAEDLTHRAAIAIENARLYRELREDDRRKDEFLATLAHELRNPLAPIRNSLQVLKMPHLAADAAERARAMMERQVHHLVRLVDDLLDVSRVMRGKIELRKERIELATVVARAVETAQPLIEAQGHELMVQLPDESLPLDADPVRLAQVVGNLLTNAAKYTEPNGRIGLTARRQGEYAELRVRDTGIGIAPDMIAKVFDLFVQVDHAATRSQGGLGIGLTLVRNLVEMHHGTVEAHSPGLGKGSEFVVRLPLAAAKRNDGPAPATPGAHAVPPTGRRLLVVDDNRDAADSLAMLLRLQGHEVQVANDGLAALEMAEGYRPELVLLDIGMPIMDGYEVARRLRRLPGLEHVRLAALTGWGQQADRRRSAEAGFDDHLVKPVEPRALEHLLAGLNDKKDLAR